MSGPYMYSMHFTSTDYHGYYNGNISTAMVKQYILSRLISASRAGRDVSLQELQFSAMISFNITAHTWNLIYNELKSRGLIVVDDNTKHENYKKYIECMDNNTDKRVKNKKKYCMKQYPHPLVVRITDLGRVEYIHTAFCLSYYIDRNHEIALENMKLAELFADLKTQPPTKC